jgi:glutaredoxin
MSQARVIMGYIFRSVRLVLGYIIVIVDRLTRPRKPQHTPEKKTELDSVTSQMALYQFKLCPFCVKTRRTIRRLGLDIEVRDARNDPKWNSELIGGGGKYQVPCLRIADDNGEVKWLYQSTQIKNYLDQRFSETG